MECIYGLMVCIYGMMECIYGVIVCIEGLDIWIYIEGPNSACQKNETFFWLEQEASQLGFGI
jgi:hypothetical protein